MEYKIYKMKFTTGVHFGNERLVRTQNVFYADILFSALCHEALFAFGEEGLQRFAEKVKNGSILFSDGLPYIENRLFVPKPIIRRQQETKGDSQIKKEAKKLKYIDIEQIDDYMKGDFDIKKEREILEQKLGCFSLRTQVHIKQDEDAEPYPMEVYHFSENSGLYFIVGYEQDEDMDFVNKLIDSLSYRGIGGRLSSGLGKFTLESPSISIKGLFERDAKTYMSISISMAREEELEDVLDDATYQLIRRGGFVASGTYAENPVRKNDLYVFCAGSCFSKTFQGDVFNVLHKGKHNVYRYAKPMLLGVM